MSPSKKISKERVTQGKIRLKMSRSRERMIYFEFEIYRKTIFWNNRMNCSFYNQPSRNTIEIKVENRVHC